MESGRWALEYNYPKDEVYRFEAGRVAVQNGRDISDLGMSADKCNAAFRGLFQEVYRAMELRVRHNDDWIERSYKSYNEALFS